MTDDQSRIQAIVRRYDAEVTDFVSKPLGDQRAVIVFKYREAAEFAAAHLISEFKSPHLELLEEDDLLAPHVEAGYKAVLIFRFQGAWY